MDNHTIVQSRSQLHQKYYTLYTTIKLLRTKANDTLAKTRLDRYNYYSGKAPAEVYVEEPFPYKVRDKESMSMHLNADEKLSKVKLKIEYYDTMLEYLEDILKMIHNWLSNQKLVTCSNQVWIQSCKSQIIRWI